MRDTLFLPQNYRFKWCSCQLLSRKYEYLLFNHLGILSTYPQVHVLHLSDRLSYRPNRDQLTIIGLGLQWKQLAIQNIQDISYIEGLI